MIRRANYKNVLDLFEFINRVKDVFYDMYITKNKERIFLTDLHFIEKILQTQEVYILEEREIKGILLIYREKGYRPYVKILADSQDSARNLIKALIWNFSDKDLFIKLKKINPLLKIVQRYGFVFSGDRGREILLFRQGIKKINKGDNREYDNRKNS